MNMTGVSIIGWLHTLACTAAIAIGALLIFVAMLVWFVTKVALYRRGLHATPVTA